MITVHPANADDFSTLGYGALTETEAPIEEHAGGMYQLTLTHPMDEEGRWHYLQKYNIIKAPAPVREVPSFVVQEETPGQTVTRQIYRVDTPSGKRLHLRQKGSLSAKIITMYKPGTEVVRLSVSGDWARVVVCKGGATGYMWADYLKYVRTETETVPGTGSPGKVIQPKQTREQLFRITRPEKDDAAQLIRVKALHISYDLSGNAVRGALELDNVPADEAVERILAQANDAHPFSVYCNSKKPVSGDWTGKSVAAALWGDGGVVQQIGGELIRDNFDIYILDDAQRDLGAEVRHGKNMLGAVAYEDVSGVLTRIIPVGKNKDGSRLMLDGTPYVESPRAAEIPVIRSKEIEYDVQVGSDGISTVAAARAKLRELAAADFANGADGTVVGLDVDFVQLENTVEYAQYADLQTIHLYDIVHVISGRSDIRAGVRMTGYVFEASGPDPHYTAVTLGEITELETTIYGYDMAEGSMPGTKIINNSVSGAKLRNASIEYAKIAAAAIEQLVANSITAVRAHINGLVAGSITTDQLYADLATLAAAQITAAKIAEANIDWASIVTLQATIATIAKAQITAANIEEANIQWAEIDSLAAKMAEIAQAKIDNAEIDAAQITDLEAEVARLVNASIKSADIGFAQIKDLVAGTAIITQGVGGELYISRLAVTEANMVSLSVGELVVKGSDGHFYALGVDASGNITTTLKQVVNDDVADLSINAGEKIIEGTVTAACLNANDIFANNAIIRQLIAANIDVATLFAREATVAQLNAADISGNKYLKLAVEGVKVGGRNLVLDSGTVKSGANDTVNRMGPYWVLSDYGKDALNAAGVEFAVSYEAKASVDGQGMDFRLRGDASSSIASGYFSATLTTQWQRYSGVLTTTGTGGAKAWALIYGNAASGTVEIRNVKFELGNKPTDWSPAPEDAEGEIADLAARVSSAEQKITADAIVSTVTSSETYKGLANTAGTAKSTADAAKSSAGTNAANITALTTRVTTAETKIEQKADSIQLSVLRTEVEGIEIGGRNLVLDGAAEKSDVNGTSNRMGPSWLLSDYGKDALGAAGVEFTISYEARASVEGQRADIRLRGDATSVIASDAVAATLTTQWQRYSGTVTTTGTGGARAWVHIYANAASGTVEIRNVKFELGNKPTDWSPAPEDPAKSLVTGTTVTITDEKFDVQTKEASFSIIDDSTGEVQEKLRIDEDGLTSEEATFGTIHSDSVVATQAAATYTPANAGEMQAILDNLSNRFLTGNVTINAANVTGGDFKVSGLSGNGMFYIRNGTLNGLTMTHCQVTASIYDTVFSTSGTAVTAYMSRIYMNGCTVNAASGLYLERFAEVILNNCTGTCTKLADVTYSSVLRFMGNSLPYGVLGTVTGEVYSPIEFADPPSAPSVPTVTSTSLAATSTRTWNGGWISGNVLYQGKTGSDGQLRRGCMWFDTSAISGKTIVSATLTLKRVDGIGGGGSVAVGIYGTTTASASGTPAVGTKYASVSLANGATKSVDVTEAVKALAAGSIKGLMVYDTQTGTFNSKNYTYGYCKLYGSGDSAKPVLNVVYK